MTTARAWSVRRHGRLPGLDRLRWLALCACLGGLTAGPLPTKAAGTALAESQVAEKGGGKEGEKGAGDAEGDGSVARLTGAFGGWRHSGLAREGERYVAAYPRPPVDRGQQRFRTLIEGQLRHIDPASRRPPTLVVNGNATPLYADSQGWFARPWAFGAGSNSIELISSDGRTRQRMQFYEADRSVPQALLRAIVTWDDPHAQVDLHVITPDGLHAFFANPILADGSGFDVDSVDGAGPGIFSSAAPQHGAWLFFLNYWGNFDENGYNFRAGSHDKDVITATLTLVFNENTPNERRETSVVPLRKIGDLMLVKRAQL